jgi:hypothetical protein
MRNLMFACIVVVLSLLILPTIPFSSANPIPWPKQPNTDLPAIQIATPDGTVSLRDNNTAVFNITVTRPDSWNNYYMGFIPIIGDWDGWVYLDGARMFPLPPQRASLTSPLPASVSLYQISFNGYPDTSLAINGINRKWGNLTYNGDLEIRIDVMTYSEVDQLNRTSSQTVSFGIDPHSQTITFSKGLLETINGTASAPTPIINPTTNPTKVPPIVEPTQMPRQNLPVEININQSITAAICFVIAALVIASAIITYKRHKSKTALVWEFKTS